MTVGEKYLVETATILHCFLFTDMDEFEKFCGGKLWDEDSIWNTDNPDFTPCFHNTILAWIPAGFLLLTSPFELTSWFSSKCPRIPFTVLNIFKLLFTLALVAACVVEIVFLDKYQNVDYVQLLYKVTDANYVGEAVMMASYLFSALMLIMSLR